MLDTQKVESKDLVVGMYVSALDRPWLDTPFLIQGFRLESSGQIEEVQKYCEFVFVDITKSRDKIQPLLRQVSSGNSSVPINQIFPGRALKEYETTSEWKEESAQAWVVLDALVDDVNSIFNEVSTGENLNVVRLKTAVAPVVESMSRNPDACIWLARLKQHDQYAYQHSLSAAIWAVALARQLGLPRLDLRSLAMGCMLMDVGKLRVDPELLHTSEPYTEEQSLRMQAHVQHGVDIIQESGLMNQDVIDIVANHHERFDGSGYPNGLKGDEIPAIARIAGIVDTYDAVTSHRSHAPAVSPSNAVKLLYKTRNIEFQAELVEAFIQAVGIYPAGTIVELLSGEVGVVVSEYRTRRLKPKVMVLLDRKKNHLREPSMLDLSDESARSGGKPLGILKSLEPGAYDIDLSKLKV